VPDTGIDAVSYAYLHSRTIYTPWSVRHYDENQCLKDSEYYVEFYAHIPEKPDQEWIDKKQAIEQAVVFHGTGITDVLDAKGSLIGQILDREGNFSVYEYDGCRQVVRSADPRQAKRGGYNLICERNMIGEIVRSISCDRGTTCSITDNKDWLVSATRPGIQHRYDYDGLGRMLKCEADGLGIMERYIYGESISEQESKDRNLRGNVLKIQDQSGEEVYEVYTISQQVKRKYKSFCQQYTDTVDWNREILLEQTAYKEEYFYDIAGNLLEHHASDGFVYRWGYNLLGQQSTVWCVIGQDNPKLLIRQHYNAQGNREEVQYGNETKIVYTYDAITGQLRGMQAKKADKTVIQSLCYTCDPTGKITRIREIGDFAVVNHGQVIDPIWEYHYDEYGRLIRAGGRELAGDSGDFANLSRYEREYAYDMGGNLCRMVHHSMAGNYAKEFEIEDNSNHLRQAAGRPVVYGEEGCVRNMDGTVALEYNYQEQMVHAVVIQRSDADSDEKFYVYDNNGRRVRKVSRRRLGQGRYETIQTLYVDECRIVRRECDGQVSEQTQMNIGSDSTTEAVVYHLTQDTKDIWQTNYMLSNHTNAVNVELNGQGDIVRFEEYFPFGETALLWTDKREVSIKDYRYCGKERDVVTGLYDYASRYYHPVYMRMMSADALDYVQQEYWQTMNLYAYCINDPVNYTDPTGHCATSSVFARTAQTIIRSDSRTAPQPRIPSSSPGIYYFYGNDQRGKAERDILPDTKMVSVTRSGLISQWNAIDDTKQPTVIINVHGNPCGAGGITKNTMDQLLDKNISLLVLFSCNTASPVNITTRSYHNAGRTGANIAETLAAKDGIDAVVGTRGFHQGMFIGGIRGANGQYVHTAIREFGGTDIGIEPYFVLYQKHPDGHIVSQKLARTYSSTEEFFEKINLQINQNREGWRRAYTDAA